jgi:hypothetical protein
MAAVRRVRRQIRQHWSSQIAFLKPFGRPRYLPLVAEIEESPRRLQNRGTERGAESAEKQKSGYQPPELNAQFSMKPILAEPTLSSKQDFRKTRRSRIGAWEDCKF